MSFDLKYNFAQVARESGFQLRSYKDGHLDWRLVGSVEIERVLREQNLEQIDSVLGHLSEVPLGTLLETNILDTGIAKYFLLSQFAIQYLLFCRKFLEETVADLREAHGSAQMEIATLKRSLSEANNEILQLHKKVSQMEAIHEVIYPCHLCTKNFVSNDALNLHISRKHNGDQGKHDHVRVETPVTAGKERDNDLNLINAIKLELEVKHLKERLNNAERKIKENSEISANEKTRCCDGRNDVVKHSIGIQSNLSEIKESDEIMDVNSSAHYESSEQISVLQDNLQELNQWKKEQQMENLAFLADIENKFKDLSKALEMTQTQQKQKSKENNEQQTTTSFKQLEEFVNKKMEDIVSSSGEKMNEVINKMEISYNSKLDKLEKQLDKLTRQGQIPQAPAASAKENNDIIVPQNKVDSVSMMEVKKEETPISSKKIELSNKTFVDTTTKVQPEDNESVLSQSQTNETASSPSNCTYIKSNSLKKESDDSSDISDEISEDEDTEDNVKESKLSKAKKPERLKKIPPRLPQKPVTRRTVNKLTNNRLLALGIDTKTKSLTKTTMVHVSDELTKRRNILKNKHPNFYATRNKIKKFVDKLCSTKMPDNAGKLLKATQEPEIKKQPTKNEDSQEFSSSDDDDDSEILIQSTNVSTPVSNTKSMNNNDFRQRLENILASPIKKPEDNYTYTTTSRQQQRTIDSKPIPMPRKRVMFTQENL